ncbi:MAG: DUF2723 domain-containing protein [Gemmatimonadaceae bacterium]|nr:DUF2723 domain-containing protein [Gemmatimonadaceae bacterium]
MDVLSSRSTRVAAAAAAAALALLIIGYTLLWHGGTSLAALLITLGYVVGIPLAIVLAGRDGTPAHPDGESPPWRVATAVWASVLLLYVLTLAPTTAMWDASEYIAAAKVLGIPHPPGNPMFVLLAHSFALLPVPLSFAGRVNLLAATTSALSAAFWFLVAFRAMRGWEIARTPRTVIAVAAAWIGATSFTVWNQSVVNEKVYTVAMLGLAASAWCAMQWRDAQPGSRRATSLLVLIAYLCGLGYANHPAGFLPLPALGVFVLWQRPQTLLAWRTVLLSALLLAIGLTPFLQQPIRAAYHPAINVGAPTACEGPPQLSCTFSRQTLSKVLSNVSRDQYGGHRVAERQAPLAGQFGMWWQYFEWQTMRDVLGATPRLQRTLALCLLMLGLYGGWLHFRRDRSSFAFFGPLVFTLTPALIVYLNFKYGATQAPDLGNSVAREVRDRDYFFLWSFATWGVWVGLGLGGLWQHAARALSPRGSLAERATPAGWSRSAVIMGLALFPLLLNSSSAPRRGQDFTARWGRDLLESVEPNGILITSGDNDSFPVWYAQLVEGVRPDVTIAITPYLNMDWFAAPLVPSAAQIPPYVELQQAVRFEHGPIVAQIPPGYLTRDQLMVLQIIKDRFPKQPIHFSIGGYAQALGLGPYIVTHGLTQRLVNEPVSGNPRYLPYDGGHIDLAVSDSLWRQYQGPNALLRQSHWVDTPSVSIPAAYVVTGQLVGFGRIARGDTTNGDQLLQRTDSLARIAGLLR